MGPAARLYAVTMALLLVLSLLGGCAGVTPGSGDGAARRGKGASVKRLKGEREGFIIKEVPQLTQAARADFERATGYLHEKDYHKAIELLQGVIDAKPGVTAPYINMAWACRQIKKYERAEEHLKIALSLVPAHPVASNEYGLLLRQMGRFDEARGVYEEALKRFPEYLPLRRNLGILCDLYLGDLKCALEQYELYSRSMPKEDPVNMWIADLRMRMGQ